MREVRVSRVSGILPINQLNSQHIADCKVGATFTFKMIAVPPLPGVWFALSVHQNRLLKLAREGRKMSSRDLAKFTDIQLVILKFCFAT
ncbi:hypothetical protein ROSI111154_24590 [Rouxiella silvae]|jgi:hypothetical protein